MLALTAADPQWVGPYRVVARLGAGGMGIVYLGVSRGGRQVAVKVLRPESAEDWEFRRRFAREVTSARAVSGAFTAAVVDADPEGSPPWLATAYVQGVSLRDALAEHGPLPEASAYPMAAGLAEALESIHTAGVIHRDLKPSNVLLAEDGPRLIDFGISTVSGSSVLTQDGQVFGTPGFMSPEQLKGDPVGTPSDVFSLGAVLVFAVTGDGPFGTGSMPQVGYRAVYEEPDLDAVPSRLRPVLAWCLAKEPGERPSVSSLLRELTELNGSGPEATEVFTDIGWLPMAIAHTVQSRAAAQSVSGAPDGHGAAGPDARERALPRSAPSGMSRRRVILGLAGAAVASAAVAGWSVFREDSGQGHERWRFATGGAVIGTPAAAKGLVYAVSKDNHLYAVDAGTGQQRWKVTTRADTYPAPTVADGILYLSEEDSQGSTKALDAATGEPLWESPSIWPRPIVRNGVAYLVTRSTIAGGRSHITLEAKDAADGRRLWTFETDTPRPAVAVGHGAVFVAGMRNLQALDAATGEPKWTAEPDMFPDPALLVVGRWVLTQSLRGLHALDAATGRVGWKFTGSEMVGQPGSSGSGRVCAFSKETDDAVALHAFDASNGRHEWKYTINDDTGSDLNPPIVTKDMVYVSAAEEHRDKDSTFRALDTRTGRERWLFTHHDIMTLQPVVASGVVYLGSGDKHLYAMDGRTGRQVWKFVTGGRVYPPVVADGVAYAGSEDGHVYAVSL
ncbi:serine/threonine-protein kinase [Streptomyces sp. NPDC006207]